MNFKLNNHQNSTKKIYSIHPKCVVYSSKGCPDLAITPNERSLLEVHVADIVARKIKTFNIQFIISSSDNTKEDQVTMYQMHVDRDLLNQLSVAKDPVATLLNGIYKKSKDFRLACSGAVLLRFTKLNRSRRSTVFSAGQNPYFNVIIHSYKYNVE